MGREASDSGATRIFYLSYEFPVLTQTFTSNEVVGLRREGLDVTVVSCRRAADPAPPGVSVRVLPSPLSGACLGALLVWIVRRPVRLLGLFARVAFARYRDERLRCRLRGFLQLLWGCRLARDLEREGRRTHLHAQFVDAASTVAWAAARLVDGTYSVTNHTAYNPYLAREKLRTARPTISISDFDRRHLRDLAGLPEGGDVRVLRQGIDLGAWPFREPGPPSDPPRLLAVAALREKKGLHLLPRALSALDRPARLTIVGEGPERARIEAAVRDHGVGDRVVLTGAEPPERVRERLAGADVFVLPCTVAANGDLDGIPISLMEAMAAGVPVVSTRLSGIPELVEDGEEGLLVEPDDADAIAAAVARLLDAPDLAARLARAARRKVERRHDLRESVRRLAEILREAGA